MRLINQRTNRAIVHFAKQKIKAADPQGEEVDESPSDSDQ